jgi:hypothetical protein
MNDSDVSDRRVMKVLGDLPVFRPSAEDLARHLRSVFLSSPEGRRVLSYLLDLCEIFDNPVCGDLHVMVRAATKRGVGLHLIGDMLFEPPPGDREGVEQAGGPLDEIVAL